MPSATRRVVLLLRCNVQVPLRAQCLKRRAKYGEQGA
jgi:hypothetical protein